MAQVNAGRVRFIGRGEYDNSTQYYTFDLVNYNGNSYFAKSNTMGNLPTNSTYWQLVAEKGNVGPAGPTGNGIDHISLTSQSGATKVYTIYFTDGNTTTFTVQDGEVTQEVFDEEIERANMIYNAMPKVSGEGTDLTLNNTAECPVYDIELSPSELEQETTSISEGDEYDSPSPEHPQEIHTVSGENTITISNSDNTQSQTYPLSLGDLEYCKIGDYEDLFFKNVVGSDYYDSTLELDKWYLKKNTKKLVLDGTENWFNDGGRAPFSLRNTNVARNNNRVMVMSDCFRGVKYNSSWSAYDYLVSTSTSTAGTAYLKFKYLGITTLEDFKTWLAEHNPIVYYALATPENILLSDTLQTQLDNIQKAITYQDQTNVSQENNDLPFVIKLSAIRDLSGIFEEI